jgi:hypothetical protein
MKGSTDVISQMLMMMVNANHEAKECNQQQIKRL